MILDEPELHLGSKPDIVVPDLAGWRRERVTEDFFADEAPAHIELAPDWVCEVISPSTEREDRGVKMRIYRREKVGHVWLLDPAIRTLEVYRLENGRYSLLDTFDGDDAVRVEPFDAIALELRVLWARERQAPRDFRSVESALRFGAGAMKRIAFTLAGALVLIAGAVSAQEAPWSQTNVPQGVAQASDAEQTPGAASRTQPPPMLSARHRERMMFAGAMAFGIPYALTVGFTLGFARGASDLSDLQVWLLVPGVGPLIALGPLLDEPCDTGLSGLGCGLGKVFGTPLFVVDGLAQLVGIGVFIAGLTRSAPSAPHQPEPGTTRLPWWVLAPGAPGTPLGLTITGQHF